MKKFINKVCKTDTVFMLFILCWFLNIEEITMLTVIEFILIMVWIVLIFIKFITIKCKK